MRRLILGGAGSGKTHHLLSRLEEYLSTAGGEGALLLLPTEIQAGWIKRTLLERGINGLMGTSVAGFSSLAEAHLRRSRDGSKISEPQKGLLLRRLLSEGDAAELEGVREFPGTLEGIKSVIKEIKGNCLGAFSSEPWAFRSA